MAGSSFVWRPQSTSFSLSLNRWTMIEHYKLICSGPGHLGSKLVASLAGPIFWGITTAMLFVVICQIS